MTEIKIGGAQSYILPLESIDLTYLSKYVRNPNKEKIPLWSKKCLDGESEYYEVKIITQEINEDCYSEPSDTYKCHICNVHVPITCSKEHNKSKKHETFKNIFDQVLERVSKQINSISINNDKHIHWDEYYCVLCSKIVKIENKSKHESSTYHIKSQEYINVVNEFYKIFKENNSNDDDRIVVNDEESDLDSEYAYKGNNSGNVAKLNGVKASCTLDSDDDSISTISNNLVAKLKINTEKPIKNNNNESFEEYLKEMIKKYNLKVNLPVIVGDDVFVMAPNGGKVKVSREQFQSYRQLKSTIYCQMCKMWISQDTRAHDVTENHVRHIFKPINENFARTIDAVSSHCIPCNEVVLSASNHHTLNDNHKKIIKDTITPISINNVTKKTLCDVCNVYIDTHNFKSHTYSKKHLSKIHQKKKNNDCTVNNNKTNKPTEISNKPTEINKTTNKPTEISNKPIEINNKINNSEYCDLCKVKVPKGGMKIHIAGKPHRKIIIQLCTDIKNELKNDTKPSSVAQNASSSHNTRNEYTPSTSSISSEFVTATNSSNDDKIDEYYDLLVFTNETKTQVKCTICGVNIVFLERNIIEHMEGRLHKKNVNKQNVNKQKMNIYNKLLLYTDDDKTKVKCQICDIHVPYIERNIIEHMEGRLHKENVNKENVNKQKMNIYNKLLLSYTDDDKTKVKCLICDVDVPDIERNIIEHMEGRNHEAVQNELLLFHSLTRESTGFVCGCCKIHTTNYLEHINSRTHTIKYQLEYVIEKNDLRKFVYEDDINNSIARLNRERYRNLLKHNNIYKINDSSYYCVLCHMGRINEIDHVLGERHRVKVEELNLL